MLGTSGCGNAIVKARLEHAANLHGSIRGPVRRCALQMFRSRHWETIPTDTRYICKQAIKQMNNIGLEVLATYEIEFRLFKLKDGQPAWQPCSTATPSCSAKSSRSSPIWSVAVAQRGLHVEVMFAAQRVRRSGLIHDEASFLDRRATGWHLNLSLWTSGNRLNNIFHAADSSSKQLSTTATDCGQLANGELLPTAAHALGRQPKCDYGVDNRMTTFRLQTQRKETSRVESRIVSSACNPYLALWRRLSCRIWMESSAISGLTR
uniref:Lengsin n=1 Tax=Macrostomum lignano TaxID=282301 RepID=A0A1I8FNI3_9PLAT